MDEDGNALGISEHAESGENRHSTLEVLLM
jgi:hypothetical protein